MRLQDPGATTPAVEPDMPAFLKSLNPRTGTVYVSDPGSGRILVLSSGGVFSEGPWKDWDAVEPYLRRILGFIGIQDIQIARAEGMNIPPIAPQAIPAEERAIETLAI